MQSGIWGENWQLVAGFKHAGLSQNRFAKRYRINVTRLRDLEQGRTKADSALLAYMAVIEREPEAVERALGLGLNDRGSEIDRCQ